MTCGDMSEKIVPINTGPHREWETEERSRNVDNDNQVRKGIGEDGKKENY
jgi:hypothetical protein